MYFMNILHEHVLYNYINIQKSVLDYYTYVLDF